jgi:hypothetical protein
VPAAVVGSERVHLGKLGPGYPGAGALAAATRSVPAQPVRPPPADAHAGLPEYWRQGCLVDQTVATPKECVYGDTTNPTLTVALVGDSIAGNWFAPLLTLALRYRWELVTDMHAVCTFHHHLARRNGGQRSLYGLPPVGRRRAARPAHHHPSRCRDHIRPRRPGLGDGSPGRPEGV